MQTSGLVIPKNSRWFSNLNMFKMLAKKERAEEFPKSLKVTVIKNQTVS